MANASGQTAAEFARATLALAEERYNAAFAEFEAVLRDAPDDFLPLYDIGR